MASFITFGLGSWAVLELVSGISFLLGIFNTSVQGISNVTSILRSKKSVEYNDIKFVIDDELILEVKIKVLLHFIDELKEIKFNPKKKQILETIITKLKSVVKTIEHSMIVINNKINYNESLWLFQSLRKYKFNDDEIILRKLDKTLEILSTEFYKCLESDYHYQEYKKKNTSYKNLENEKLVQSELLMSQIFNSVKN